jgi:hypothetical protein
MPSCGLFSGAKPINESQDRPIRLLPFGVLPSRPPRQKLSRHSNIESRQCLGAKLGANTDNIQAMPNHNRRQCIDVIGTLSDSRPLAATV